MAIVGVFNGANIIQVPPKPGLAHLSIKPFQTTGSSTNPWTRQQQVYDWMNGGWEGQFDLPPMKLGFASRWRSFFAQLHGQANVFMLGDPKSAKPLGNPTGIPLVTGAGQTGYTLAVDGFRASSPNVLMEGDYIQVGVRLYMITADVSADSSGGATLHIWPQIRAEGVTDNEPVITQGAQGLFRLAPPGEFGWSVNESGLYGFDPVKFVEAL